MRTISGQIGLGSWSRQRQQIAGHVFAPYLLLIPFGGRGEWSLQMLAEPFGHQSSTSSGCGSSIGGNSSPNGWRAARISSKDRLSAGSTMNAVYFLSGRRAKGRVVPVPPQVDLFAGPRPGQGEPGEQRRFREGLQHRLLHPGEDDGAAPHLAAWQLVDG